MARLTMAPWTLLLVLCAALFGCCSLAAPATTHAGSDSGSAPHERRATFRHPGVLNSIEQLDFVKGKVAAGQQPWKGAFDNMMGSSYGSLTRGAKPTATVVSD